MRAKKSKVIPVIKIPALDDNIKIPIIKSKAIARLRNNFNLYFTSCGFSCAILLKMNTLVFKFI